jgi:hypothetical protein
MIPPSWPFAVWGVDILGPFPRAVDGYRYLFVAIDKFTKWPKATPVVSITQSTAVTFLKSIVCRFGVPSRIITDNGTQFTSRSSRSTVKASTPSSASHPWPTLGATDRWREQMQRSSGDSRRVPMTA